MTRTLNVINGTNITLDQILFETCNAQLNMTLISFLSTLYLPDIDLLQYTVVNTKLVFNFSFLK